MRSTWSWICRLVAALVTLVVATPAGAQNRGVYPLGMSAINSGLSPAPGFTYANQLLIYSRDRAKDGDGNTLVTGANMVVMDMNTLTWVSDWNVLGARYAASATIPFARNSLTSDVSGNISGGAGLADSYYLPVILGWSQETYAVRAMYGFLAPTGKFNAGASDNVGSGYWTHTLSSGQTFHLAKSRRFTVSAFEMYEFHTTQEGTGLRPGDTFDLDYSIMGSVAGSESWRLQLGVAGYEALQTTAKFGPGVTSAAADERYRVNAAGVAANATFPKHKASAGLKVFKEFANRSTYEGYSVQIVGAVSF